jgi:hypothetical protein
MYSSAVFIRAKMMNIILIVLPVKIVRILYANIFNALWIQSAIILIYFEGI